MKQYFQSLCLLLFLNSNSVTADTKNIQLDIGGVTIDVQAPNGFHEISSLSPETRQLVKTMMPPDNRLLGVFVSEEDLGRIMKAEAPELSRYMSLQVFRKLENTTLSNRQFQQLANQLKEEQNTLLNKAKDKAGLLVEGAAENISKEYEISLEMRLGELVPLGMFFEQSNAVGFASLAKMEVEVEGEKFDEVVAGGMSFLLARGKLLYAYVYSTYETQDDVNWVRTKSKEWVNSILTRNNTSTQSSGSTYGSTADPAREFLDGNRTTFNTQNHAKAKGVHFTIAYPSSWAAKEGTRPNIVQKFVSEGGRGQEMALIITKALPLPAGTGFTEADLKEFFTPTEMKEMLPAGAKFINAKQTRIEGLPAGILEFSMRQERAGLAINLQVISYIFIHRSTMVQFQCTVSGLAASQGDISRRMATFKPLFTLMANSIVIPDKWTAAPDMPTSSLAPSSSSLPYDDPSLLIMTLVVSFIVTWALGLTPPLLIRYAFVRRPLTKKAASWIAAGFSAFFWMAFLVLNSALGEKPGTGVVWIIMFFVSRWIMSRGYVPAPRVEEQTAQGERG